MTARTLAVVLVAVSMLAGCGATPVGSGSTATTTHATTTSESVPSTVSTDVEATTTATTATGPPDADGDGLSDSRERELGTKPDVADTDDDGLSDGAEVLATETLPDADPLHRDVYLELDYMAGERPDASMLATVERRFASAPVSNPDGERGIDLHVRIDEEVPARAVLVAAHEPGDLNDVFDYRRRFADLTRRGYFYGVVVGELEYPNASVRDLQGYAYADFFASENTADRHVQDNVLMHELGHVVGLGPWRYPGIDSRRVPFDAYPSAMNYRAPGDYFGFSDGSAGSADFDDWHAIATCQSWAGYDDAFPAVTGANATGGGGTGAGRSMLAAGVGCL